MNRYPWIEISLMVGLPILVLVAGAFTTALAMEKGFTPLETVIVHVGH